MSFTLFVIFVVVFSIACFAIGDLLSEKLEVEPYEQKARAELRDDHGRRCELQGHSADHDDPGLHDVPFVGAQLRLAGDDEVRGGVQQEVEHSSVRGEGTGDSEVAAVSVGHI
jgi:hypothetical protein